MGFICAVCILVIFAGIYAGLHKCKKEEAVQAEVASTAMRAAHGADERADQGEESPPPQYSQMTMAGVPIVSLTEQVVPVGLPVAASADGSWAPASGVGRMESGSGLELSPAVVTGLVLPNVLRIDG
tara:strand:- start:183 stop:563 length:381 start_codon:yes stop_codon:yes gene_type:complete|eukprot:scaffold42659_cov62-Phaeocystis_antarctica.AAC.16